ncbi:MAG: Ig-like domain-containing protein [Methanobrevibacter sp.]|uniref:Ig-like domain-containing protein n=1 Tax=Methanobrevibacter sp. TaxID=66852 RepID=UPI0026E0192F|nr:Ig-like domain-containing protein [Methanobrevibacter sp.]MDO5849091.1 Ig-like domain-containing protein [Methanobrevibacter sp.]
MEVTGFNDTKLNGNVTITIDDTISFNVNVTNGVGTFDKEITLGAGAHTVTAQYLGESNHSPSATEVTFSIEKAESNIEAEINPITYGENIKGNVTLTGVNSAPLNGNVNITVGGKNYSVEVVDGEATFDLPNELEAGENTIVFTFDGSNDYNASTDIKTVTVEKSDDAVVSVDFDDIVYGKNITGVVTLVGVNSTPLNGTVNISVNGKDYEINVVDGKASFELPNDLDAGDYSVNSTFVGDKNYKPSSETQEVSVEQSDDAVVSVDFDDVSYGKNITGVVTLVGVNSTPLNGTVNISVNGKDYEINVVDGKASFELPNDLDAGDYSVNSTFVGDKNYKPSSETQEVSVEQSDDAVVSVDFDDVSYGKNITGVVTLVGVNSTPLNGTVNISVNGKDYEINVVDGKASFELPNDLDAGDYSVNSTFVGDKNYKPSSETQSVNVEKADSSIEVNVSDVTYGESVEVNVTVTGVGSAPLNGTVSIAINGKTYEIEVTDGKGSLSISDLLGAGDYTITSTFAGDKNYNPAVAESQFKVLPVEVELNLDSIDIVYGDNEVVTITTNLDIPINVTLSLNKVNSGLLSAGLNPGEKITVEINGSYDLNLGVLDAGNYRVIASYAGDSHGDYNKTVNSTVFTVIKANTTNELTVKNVTFGDTISGEISVTGAHDEGVNGNAILTINDREFPVSIVNGEGKFNIDYKLSAGNHTMGVAFEGNKNYNPSSNETNFTIEKAELKPVITATQDGKSVVVEVRLPNDADETIMINVNGVEYSVDVVDGYGKLIISNIPIGNNEFIISLPGNENYTDEIIKMNFTMEETKNNGAVENGTVMAETQSNNELKTGNPIALLLLVLMALPIRRIFKR